MECPLCGLGQLSDQALADHTARVHKLDTDAVDRMLRSGRRDLADDIEEHWSRAHGTRLPEITRSDLEAARDHLDEKTGRRRRGTLDGGYL